MKTIVLPILVCALSSISASPAVSQDPLVAFPNNYKLILDNADIAVMRVHYGPHEKIGVHDHSNFPTIYVYLNNAGQVRFTHDEAPPFVMTRPPVTERSLRISPGRIERHSVENLSDQSSDFLRIELKKLPLHDTLRPFRTSPPAKLVPGDSEEFSSPELTIRRLVCENTDCASSSSALTLLVAISPSLVTAETEHSMSHLKSGDIHWLPRAQSLHVAAESGVPAHLLEITLHAPVK